MVNLETLNYEKLIIVERMEWLYFDKFTHKPVPVRSIISPMNEPARTTVLNYLKSGTVCESSFGAWADEITGKTMPLNTNICFTDGKFEWKYKTMYYFEKYGMRLPEEFVNHILEQEPK